MLQLITNEDFEQVYNLYMHPKINPHLLYEQMDEKSFLPIYEKLVAEKIVYLYVHANSVAGMCKLKPLDYRSAHVIYLGGFAIHPFFWGKGLGVKMLDEIIEFVKAKNFKRIELSVGIRNEKAIATYEKAGFIKEGILRKYTYLSSENEYIDEVMMSYLFE